MGSIQNILYPTDFSNCRESLLPQALFLSRECEAKLHILHVATSSGFLQDVGDSLFLPLDDPGALSRINEDLYNQRPKIISKDKLYNGVRISDIEFKSLAVDEGILEYARLYNIDLIIMATPIYSGLKRFLWRTTAEKVARGAECHVLSIPCSKSRGPIFSNQLRSILVPVDFSDFSQVTLSSAKGLASIYGAQIELFHVIEKPAFPPFYKTGGYVNNNIDIDWEKLVEQWLWSLDILTKGPVKAKRIEISRGNVADEIIDHSRYYADMVILASYGQRQGKGFLTRSIWEKILRRVNCPVLVLKLQSSMITHGHNHVTFNLEK